MNIHYCTGKTASGERTEDNPGQSTINSLQQWRSKGRPGWVRARPKFVPLMCARALVLLAQWLRLQQVPGQLPMTWLRHWSASCTNTIIRPLCVVHHQYPEHLTVCMCTKACRIYRHLSPHFYISAGTGTVS